MTGPDAPTAQLPPNPPPPPPPPNRLTRSGSDRMFAGVAGGIARHLDVDPVLVRLAFVVLTIFAGSGVLLYAVLALVVPAEDAPAGRPSDSALSKGAIVLLVLIACVALPFAGGGLLFFAPGLVVLALLAVGVVLIVRALTGDDASARQVLLALLAVAGALVLGFGAAAATAFGAGTVVAIVVVALGVALTVGGLLGGARWLVLPALAMAIPVGLVVAADVDLRGGVGNREVRPAAATDLQPSYKIGVGRLAVDLRDVPFQGRTDLKLHAGMGRIELVVPRDVCVQTVADIDMGDVDVLGRHSSGVDVGLDQRPQPRLSRPLLVVDADAGLGQIVVSHRPLDRGYRYDRGSEDQPACRAS